MEGLFNMISSNSLWARLDFSEWPGPYVNPNTEKGSRGIEVFGRLARLFPRQRGLQLQRVWAGAKRERAMPALTCNACNKEFDDEVQQKLHYRSEWHRYNLKRKVMDFSRFPSTVRLAILLILKLANFFSPLILGFCPSPLCSSVNWLGLWISSLFTGKDFVENFILHFHLLYLSFSQSCRILLYK